MKRILPFIFLVSGCLLDPWSVPPPAPTNLAYPQNPAYYTIGVEIAPNVPTHTGGEPDSYRIYRLSDLLPAGLSFNTATGAISGKPSEPSPLTAYTVTATNAGGSTSVSLAMTVQAVTCTYSADPVVYTLGQPVPSNTPACVGAPVISFDISRPLPAGLSFNTTTGVISGTPTTLSPQTSYTVNSHYAGGTATSTVEITVNDVAPAQPCTYSTNPAVYTKSQPITPNALACGGGAITSAMVSPPLPGGLTLGPTGTISGTPTAISSQASYTVTVSNSGGSTTTTVTITVNDVAPAQPCTYSTNPAVYIKGQTITPNVVVCGGGAIISATVSPPLPAGLTLGANGTISGTPTALSSSTSYTVTVSNSGGSTTANINIRVNDAAPAQPCTYSTNPAVYTKGQPITPNVLTCGGGVITSAMVSPSLPTGLILGSTGTISGTPNPTTPSPATNYTVTVSNSGGFTTVNVTITVNDAAPAQPCTYSTNPAVYTKGQTITPNVLVCGGGAITSAMVSPPLPTGLTLGPTGTISGTPTGLSSATSYTVTVSNSGGSTTANVNIRVNDVAPAQPCAYSTNPAVYTKGQSITSNVLVCGGGAITFATVSPSLPTGLTLGSSGTISGTPTAVSLAASYTVTVSNTGGSTTANVNIRVNDVQPSGCTYSVSPVSYTKGRAVATNVLSCAGGPLTSASVSLPLPIGLNLVTSGSASGAISGTPTRASSATDYIVTASNSGGSATVTLNVSVKVISLGGVIAAGSAHSCALADGGVLCWGNNSVGQLGNGSTVDSPTPVPVSGLSSGAQSLAAGERHTCAIADGGVLCWGNNSFGQLGNGSAVDSPTPVSVSGLSSGVQSFAAGEYHTCAVLDGGVRCWGRNGSGQLGNGSTVNSSTPVPVSGLSASVQSLAAGEYHTCAIAGGGVFCWGSNSVGGQLGNGSTVDSPTPVPVSGLSSGVQSLAAWYLHTCAIADGGVFCWGWGNPTSPTPVPVSGLSSGVQSLAAGYLHTCAIADGGVLCWGANLYGELGNGSTNYDPTPVPVSGLSSGVQALAAGSDHTCAIVGGGARCWGYNLYGQLGNGSIGYSPTPVPVSGLSSGAQALAAGSDHTCAIADGGVRCWGYNISGQLGNGSSASNSTPVPVSGLASGAQALGAGYNHSCAIAGGGVLCWGANYYGELGNGSLNGSYSPVAVSGLASGAQALGAGYFHTCAIADGGILCWGYNYSGQLGNGSTSNSLMPVPVSGLASGAQALAAGGYHTCAIADGGVLYWGDNGGGPMPGPVSGLSSGAQSLATGYSHTCAIADGGARCWGSNYSGELGNGSTGYSSTPVPVSGLSSGARSLALGDYHTCAIADGGVRCWGDNSLGQLGNGSTTGSSTPVFVPSLSSGAQSLAAGDSHTCAIVDGGIRCWGNNTHGQLGNGSFGYSPTSVPVSGLW